MPAVLFAILTLTVLGLPISLALDRSARGELLLGTSFLCGSGAIFVVLLALSVAHIQWTLVSVAASALVLFTGAAVVASRNTRPPQQRQEVPPQVGLQDSGLRTALRITLDLASLATLAGYALYATIAPLWEWDFWAIWALKARVFLEHGGVDWRFLRSHWNSFVHPDYPLLLPLNYDFLALIGGGWSDRWLGVFFVALGVALLMIVRQLARHETSPLIVSLLTFALTSIAVSRYLGMAEGTLIAFGGAGVLFVRRALLDDDAASWRQGAVFLGLAANCKNEGLALLVAVIVALLLTDIGHPRRLLRLWPAVALTVPWLLLRATHVLATDIAEGSVVSRIVFRLRFAPQILQFLAMRLYEPWFWVTVLVAVIVVPAAVRNGERFVLLVTAIQLVFYTGSYFATPHDIRWHVATSWSRLTDQIAVPITYAVVLMLAKYGLPGNNAAHAEARSQQ